MKGPGRTIPDKWSMGRKISGTN